MAFKPGLAEDERVAVELHLRELDRFGDDLRSSSVTSPVQPRRSTLEVVQRCFETGGVEIIDEKGGRLGVRLRGPTPRK